MNLKTKNMPYKEKETTKVFWYIGEVAKLCCVIPSTIRFWEREIPYIAIKKDKYSKRRYNKKQLNEVLKIAWLIQDCGLPLYGIKLAIERGNLNKIIEFFGFNAIWGYHRAINPVL